MSAVWAMWRSLIMKMSFYPLLFCLLGGIILNFTQNNVLSLQITSFFIWIIVALPLWFLGQHWVFLVPVVTMNTGLSFFSSTLFGYHVIFLSLCLSLLLCIIYAPRSLFSLYILFEDKNKHPLALSFALTENSYTKLLLHVLVFSSGSILFLWLVPFLLGLIVSHFLLPYSSFYVTTLSIVRFIATIMCVALTTLVWNRHFYGLYKRAKMSYRL